MFNQYSGVVPRINICKRKSGVVVEGAGILKIPHKYRGGDLPK